MENLANKLFDAIFNQCGILSGFMFSTIICLITLWWMERKDRRQCWKEYNKMFERNIVHNNTVITALETIKVHLTKRRR